MPFILRQDDTGVFDALGHVGDTPTVTVTSASSPTTAVTNATLNGQKLVVSPTGLVTLTKLIAGTNRLAFVVIGDSPGDDRQLTEADGPNRQVLSTITAPNVGGVASPTATYRIHAD